MLSRSEPSSDVLAKKRADLRFCCAICTNDADTMRQALQSRSRPIDWPALIETARTHRLDMLLHRAATTSLAGLVSAEALDVLRQLHADNRARGRAMTGDLLLLLDRLAREQIPAIGFKGPVLGAQLYGDIALRTYADLDVLVLAHDLPRAARVLVDLSYHETGMSLSWERSFGRPGSASIDVHWAISEMIHQFPRSADELWARRMLVPIEGSSLPTLCAEDALLVICFNGFTEDWQRCDRIADVAELLRGFRDIDWPNLLALCRRRGCERMVLVGLHLARELFNVTLPEVVERRLWAHRKALGRLGYAGDPFLDFVITSTDRRRGSDYWRHALAMRERLWERIPYYQSIAYDLFSSKASDAPWQRATRQAIYRVLRLPLLAVKHSLRRLGHGSLEETPRS